MVDADWFEHAPYPRLRSWLKSQLESALFKSVMRKHAPWEPGQQPLRFPHVAP